MRFRHGCGHHGLRTDQTTTNRKQRRPSFRMGVRITALGGALFSFSAFAQTGGESGPPIIQGEAALSAAMAGDMLIFSLVLGILLFAGFVIFWGLRERGRLQTQFHRLREDNARLRNQLAVSRALLSTDPQVLLQWVPDGAPQLLAHNLPESLGLPQSPESLMAFEQWVSETSYPAFRENWEALISQGRGFRMELKAKSGQYLLVDGRPMAGAILLRLRDFRGIRKEKASLLEKLDSLKCRENQMRALLARLPAPVWFRGKTGQLTWVNEAYVKMVGAQTIEDVLARGEELLEKRQREKVAKALAAGELFQGRFRPVIDGQRFCFQVCAAPLGEEQIFLALDVTEKDAAKAELERHIAAFDRILDSVSTAVAIFGPDGRLTYFNQPYVDLWGLDEEWLATRPTDIKLLDHLRRQRRLPDTNNFQKWKEKQIAFPEGQSEKRGWWHMPDGRNIRIVAHRGPDGSVTYLYQDETENLAIQTSYKALQNTQRETLDALREGVAVFGPDGRLRLFNLSFVKLWRLNVRDLSALPHVREIIDRCRPLYQDDAFWHTVLTALTAVSDARTPLTDRLHRPDGSVLAFSAVPLPDGATMITFADVTDSERAERALIERNEALEAAHALKTKFLSHVSHKLRAPLTSILGYSEFLADPLLGPLTEKQSEVLGNIRKAGEELEAIINDILDLAAIDEGELVLAPAPVRVGEVIGAAALSQRERLRQEGLTLTFAIEDENHIFVADDRRVVQVLQNLISNAAGFSRPGDRITISAWVEDGHVAISVEDKGCGIPAALQKTVFERFESRTRGSRHRGTGLGLPLVKSLVELHGGRVHLESQEGEGTRVTVYFPEKGPQRLRDLAGTDETVRVSQARQERELENTG